MRIYRTRSMDTWDIISKNVYGSEMFVNVLIEANIAYRNVAIFSDGIELDVPDVETTSGAFMENLPPWKRGSHGSD